MKKVDPEVYSHRDQIYDYRRSSNSVGPERSGNDDDVRQR